MQLLHPGVTKHTLNKLLSSIYDEFPVLNNTRHKMFMSFDKKYEEKYLLKRKFMRRERKSARKFVLKCAVTFGPIVIAAWGLLYSKFGFRSLLFTLLILLPVVIFLIIVEIVNRISFDSYYNEKN
jgi:fatty acid desaturase